MVVNAVDTHLRLCGQAVAVDFPTFVYGHFHVASPFVVFYSNTVFALIIVLNLRTVKNFFDGVQYEHQKEGFP